MNNVTTFKAGDKVKIINPKRTNFGKVGYLKKSIWPGDNLWAWHVNEDVKHVDSNIEKKYASPDQWEVNLADSELELIETSRTVQDIQEEIKLLQLKIGQFEEIIKQKLQGFPNGSRVQVWGTVVEMRDDYYQINFDHGGLNYCKEEWLRKYNSK